MTTPASSFAFDVSMDDVKTGFDLLPDGTYKIRFEKVTHDETNGKPRTSFQIQCESEDGTQKGRVFDSLIWLKNDMTPNTVSLGFLKMYYEGTFGEGSLAGRRIKSIQDAQELCDQLRDQNAYAAITTEPARQDKNDPSKTYAARNKVKSVMPIG